MIKHILLVGFGGFLGSALRYLVSLATESKSLFPWGTFLVNIIGCLLIGIFWELFNKQEWFTAEIRLLFTVGFCGGFTTFSSYALDAIQLGKENLLYSISYVLLSIFIGFICLLLGVLLVRVME